MAIPNQNHTMYAGESKVFTVTCTDVSTGALVDFAAATITWLLVSAADGSTALTKGVGTGIAVTGTGIIQITLAPANTSALLGTFTHQCRATLADGTVTTLFSGTINITASLI